MIKHLKILATLLLGVTLALAAPDEKPLTKNNAEKSAHGERGKAKAAPKPSFDRPPLEAGAPQADPLSDRSVPNILEVKEPIYSINTPKKETSSSSFWQSGDFVIVLSASAGLLLILAFYLILRGKKSPATTHYASQQSSTGSPDVQQLRQDILALNSRISSLATLAKVADAQTSINGRIVTLEATLLTKISDAAVAAMSKSELGELRHKLTNAQGELEKSKQAQVDKDARIESSSDDLRRTQLALNKAEDVNQTLSGNLTRLQGEVERLEKELAVSQDLVASTKEHAEELKRSADVLRAEANKGYELLAPAKLKDTDLGAQLHAMYQESLAGNVASISAWTTLTAFVAAQADPAAKDFQLQIVRRLGVTFVNYWKHQGLSEKERHDKLVSWAKSLNEHADGRYNLLVPSLGEPVDRSRMSCATTVTVVREVLCWQVRNPAGANFSLAEVA
jgi:hypothetical protein